MNKLDMTCAFQSADDKRPLDERALEQVRISMTIKGGEKTIDEYFRDREAVRTAAKAGETIKSSITAA